MEVERERRIWGRTSWSKLFLKSDETDDILNKMKQQWRLWHTQVTAVNYWRMVKHLNWWYHWAALWSSCANSLWRFIASLHDSMLHGSMVHCYSAVPGTKETLNILRWDHTALVCCVSVVVCKIDDINNTGTRGVAKPSLPRAATLETGSVLVPRDVTSHYLSIMLGVCWSLCRFLAFSLPSSISSL